MQTAVNGLLTMHGILYRALIPFQQRIPYTVGKNDSSLH